MNIVSALLLTNLPHHLTQQGWRFLRHESRKVFDLGAPRYIVVYERLYDPEFDDERLCTVVEGRVRISTRSRMSLSWIHAYHHALEAMEYIDGKRRAVSCA